MIKEKYNQSRIPIYNVILCFIICFQCIVMIYFGNQKDAFFADELYTYEDTAYLFRNNENLTDWKYRSNVLNRIHTHDDFLENLTVMEGDELQDQSLGQIISTLIYGRTYFVILNFISSFQNDSLNIWYSIGLNIFLFVFAQICLYVITKKIYDKPIYGIAVVLLYGLSKAALLTVTYIRFYELYTLVCLLHVYVHLCLLESKQVNFSYIRNIVITLVLTWIGYRNAEYMLVFSALSSAVYLLYCIKNKKNKHFWIYFGIYFAAGLMFLYKFANSLIASYFAEDSQMKTAVDRLFGGGWQLFWSQVKGYLYTITDYAGILLIAIPGFLVTVIIWYVKKDCIIKKGFNWPYLVLVTALYLIIISKISPWIAWRYVSNIYPLLFAVFIGFFVAVDYSHVVKAVILSVAFFFQLFQLKSFGQYYLSEWVDGPTFHVKEEVNDLFSGCDGICFWDERDRGLLYYAAFLWPDDAEIYLTSAAGFNIDTEEKQKVLLQNEIIVWARSEQEWNDSIKPLMEKQGYTTGECDYNTKNGRWLIYKCLRCE